MKSAAAVAASQLSPWKEARKEKDTIAGLVRAVEREEPKTQSWDALEDVA